MKKYYNDFRVLLNKVKNNKISKIELNNCLMKYFDCEYIYNSNDTLLSDIFFTLKHFALGEDDITNDEIKYFNMCLLGIEAHSFEKKINFIKNIKAINCKIK